jgi:hypothetical protein
VLQLGPIEVATNCNKAHLMETNLYAHPYAQLSLGTATRLKPAHRRGISSGFDRPRSGCSSALVRSDGAGSDCDPPRPRSRGRGAARSSSAVRERQALSVGGNAALSSPSVESSHGGREGRRAKFGTKPRAFVRALSPTWATSPRRRLVSRPPIASRDCRFLVEQH